MIETTISQLFSSVSDPRMNRCKRQFHDDIKLFLNTHLKNDFADIEHSAFETVDGEHCRIEQRKTRLINDIGWLIKRHPQWKSVNAIAVVHLTRQLTGKEETNECRYYKTSD